MNSSKTRELAMTGMVACLTIVSTMLFKIPIPFANGYIHLGDTMIFLGVLILGVRYGAASAALGSALGDILGGYAVWAPWTFVIKGVMALLAGMVWKLLENKVGLKTKVFGLPVAYIIGMAMSGIWMAAGYYFAEAAIYGNWLAPMAGVPWNIGQFVVGIIMAAALAPALRKLKK